MNIAEMIAVQKEILKQAEQIVTEATKEKKISPMNTNNTERLKIEVYKNLAATYNFTIKFKDTFKDDP